MGTHCSRVSALRGRRSRWTKETPPLIRVQRSQTPPPASMSRLLTGPDPTSRARPPPTLAPRTKSWWLANEDDDDSLVWRKVAAHPNTPVGTWIELSRPTRYMSVHCALAAKPNTPPDILERLAQSRDKGVQLGSAANPSVPEHIRWTLRLAKDPDVQPPTKP